MGSNVLIFLGTILVLIATIGVSRFGSAVQKTHAVGVGSTVGIACIAIGCGLYFEDLFRTLLVVLFFALKGPVGSHVVGRGLTRSPEKPCDL